MNSPAIRHSKKHRQSLSVVSWLSEAVKEGQWNNDAEKYYGISPYAYCGGDPVNFGDYSGKDATVTITGSNITIRACIVLTGSNATEELAKIYQMGIEKEWGAVKTFTDENGNEYSLTWNVAVTVDKSIDLSNGNVPKPDGYHNYMQVLSSGESNGNGNAASSVNIMNGYTGYVRSYSTADTTGGNGGLAELYFNNPMVHEFGHLLGLIDRYDENKNPYPGWENQIMGEPSIYGIVNNETLSGVLNPLLSFAKWLFPAENTGLWLYNPPLTLHLGNRYYREKP